MRTRELCIDSEKEFEVFRNLLSHCIPGDIKGSERKTIRDAFTTVPDSNARLCFNEIVSNTME